ncbi:hypothetical protein SAMN05216190_11734 [Pseudomonas borbori]|uniref:Uncharacterized protein n=1 Tax=Pseudomonas borbori TaxID=289003 RepID=A0A1I5SRS2_9PSED|nr:hypothetical protein SAMN05216190_11734 [Pseudomonas borbori]
MASGLHQTLPVRLHRRRARPCKSAMIPPVQSGSDPRDGSRLRGVSVKRRSLPLRHPRGFGLPHSYLPAPTALPSTSSRPGSTDYRECRKAAKVHFREQCRAWEKQVLSTEQYLARTVCNGVNRVRLSPHGGWVRHPPHPAANHAGFAQQTAGRRVCKGVPAGLADCGPAGATLKGLPRMHGNPLWQSFRNQRM